MMRLNARWLWVAVACLVLLVAGVGSAARLAVSTSTSCATTSAPGVTQAGHTVAGDGRTLTTWRGVTTPGVSLSVCATATASTVTVTAPGSTSTPATSSTVQTSTTVPTTTAPLTTTAPAGAVAPGQSWQAAYDAASCGAVIEVLAGDHGRQDVDGNRCAGNPITFHGDAGAMLSGKLTITASNVGFDHVFGHSVDILCAATNVDIGYSNFGNVTNSQPQIQSNGCTQQPTNVIIHDSSFHDFGISDPSVHNECLQILEGANVQLLRDDFHNCGGTAALGLTCNSDTAGPILVENSFVYGTPPNGIGPNYGAQISGDCRNLTMRYNSSTLDWFFADGVTGKGYTLTGNYLPYNHDLCGGRGQTVAASHNAFRGGTCGSSDTNVASLDFVSATDLHLVDGASAIDKGDPASYPATDIDGQPRYAGLAPDAGADEH